MCYKPSFISPPTVSYIYNYQGEDSQGDLQAEQGQMLGEAHHQHPQQQHPQDQPGGEEIKAVTPACSQRMPGPIVQASRWDQSKD